MLGGSVIIYENISVVDIGLLIVAVVTAILGLWQCISNHEMTLLEAELKNLTSRFRAIEEEKLKYINLRIRYPYNMACRYEVSFFRLKRVEGYFTIDCNLSVYDNFYRYVLNSRQYINTSELTLRQMIDLYNIYVENLSHRGSLNQTFQVLYTCVHNIINSGFAFKRKDRLHRVQNSLTSTQAILYFFNQVQYADRQRKNNKYLKSLYKSKFFEKMFESQEYKDIQNLIPVHVEKMFYKQEK